MIDLDMDLSHLSSAQVIMEMQAVNAVPATHDSQTQPRPQATRAACSPVLTGPAMSWWLSNPR